FLPQAMLGCKAFTNNDKEAVYFKSFSALCRPEAVGCSAFANTFNSKTDKNEIYNAICALGGEVKSASVDCEYNNEVVCSVGFGLSFCRFKITDGLMPERTYKDGVSAGIYKDMSTVEVQADKTIYVVNDKKYYCQSKDLGCSALGQGSLYSSPNTSFAYIKNKPENYSNSLCAKEGEGCESWTSNKGIDYFKVPTNSCEYRDGSANATGGWFKTGTETPCYSGLIQNGAYGIWRNADTNYTGLVGVCPQNQNACTEFVDPLDTSATNKNGKPYYLLDNDKLQKLLNDDTCGGKASLEEGCVLFNKTSDTALKWDASATYTQATAQKKVVAPTDTYGRCTYSENMFSWVKVDSRCFDFAGASDCDPPPGNETLTCEKTSSANSNIILKVTRDRECGEWLSCKSSFTAYDPVTNKAKSVCAELGLCDKSGSGSSCANFVVNSQDSGKLLTANYYGSRKVGWGNKDYSGFSLGNKYPITDVVVKNVDTTGEKDLRLCVGNCGKSSGINLPEDKNVDGTKLTSATGEKSSCRGYAEQDAPYPSSIGIWDINKQLQQIPVKGLQNANICEYGQDCECDYTKLTYGSKATVKYVDYGNRSVSTGVCQGGSRDGQLCKPGVSYEEDAKNSCGKAEEGGTCLKLQRQDDVQGWSGYCLERDLSTPINGDKNQKACLTWLPQDIVPGQRDIYNQFRTAGYIPPIGGGKYYCLQASGNYSEVSKDVSNKYSGLLVTATNYYGMADSGTIGGTGAGGFVIQPLADYEKGISVRIGNTTGAIRYFDNPKSVVDIDDPNLIARPVFKDEIDYVEIKVVSAGHPMFSQGVVFHIRADRTNTNYLAFGSLCDGAKTLDNCVGESSGSARLNGTAKARSVIEGNDWYLRFDDGIGDQNLKNFTDIDLFTQTNSSISKYCEADVGGGKNQNSYALKFHFNKDSGLLEQLGVAACSSGLGSYLSNNVELGISIKKREVCETIVDTAAFQNQAYTNVLWANNPDNKKGTLKAPAGIPYNYNYEMQPFGSASSDISPAGQGAWYSYYSVGTPNFAGVPWACIGACGTPGESNDNSGDIEFDPSKKNDAISEKAPAGNTLKPREYLGHLFAKIFSVFSLNNNSRTYSENKCSSNSTSEACFKSPSATEIVKYPKIFSFDPAKKLSNGQYKLAEENKFLINNQSNGEISIRGNQYQAVMRFYFWADTDHMPVKSIKVVWGDGSTTETTDGLYKNHKPICAKNNNEKFDVCSRNRNIVCNTESGCPINTYIKLSSSGGPDSGTIVSVATESQVCNAKEITFGNSIEACDESYFELRHIYICNTGSCTYSPKVYIVDNWGVDNTFDGDLIRNGPEYDLKNKAGFLGAATGPSITIVP
ncbi:MAG: hypothetical protein WC520_04560, partial [Candidatus Paceibacterota bacterium]